MILGSIALGTVVGTAGLFSLAELPSIKFYLCLGFICGSFIFVTRKKYVHSPAIISFIMSAILALSWSAHHSKLRLSAKITPESINKEVNIKGEVVSIPKQSQNTLNFIARVYQLNHQDLSNNSVQLELKWYSPKTYLKVGDVFEATVKLKKIHSLANKGSRDEEKFYFIKNIQAKGRVLNLSSNTSKPGFSWANFRNNISQTLKSELKNHDYLPVICALTIGMKQDLPLELRKIFQQTGTSHLLAISGLHIGLFAGLCFFVTRRLIRFFPNLLFKWPADCYAAVLTLVVSLMYAFLSGFSLPTQRAYIMLSVVMLGICFQLRVFSWQAFFIAVILVVFHDPFSILQVGFWLSFVAVFSLLMVAERSKSSFANQFIRAQGAIFLMLAPLTIFFFQQISLIAPIANLIAIPVVAYCIVPLSLLGVGLINIIPSLAIGLLNLALYLCQGLGIILKFLSQIPFASIHYTSPSLLATALIILGMILFLIPKGIPGKYFVLVLCLPFFFHENKVPNDQARISILDVGQGFAALVQTHNHTLLYDTGPKYTKYKNAGNQVILPLVHKLKINTIDKILISHTDWDHRGGLSALSELNILNIQTSEVNQLSEKALVCEQGQSWHWDGVLFEILHPNDFRVWPKRNDRSCVLKITANQQSILFTGDISERVEKKLISQYGPSLKSDILIVPHHGSLSSSSSAFIQQVAPQYAVFAAGFDNTYSLPNRKIVAKYAQFGIKNLLTFQTGMIVFQLGQGQELTRPSLWRDTAKRIWN